MSKKLKKQKKILPAQIGNKKIVMVSGGFDPVHIGHVRMFNEAKKLGDELVVVMNNDNWLNFKKGYAFMPEQERKEIIEAIGAVDKVVLTRHSKNTKDISICEELRKIKPHIFANGGDRKPDWDPVPEVAVCEELGIKMVYNIGHGGKVRSSSDLVKQVQKKKLKIKKPVRRDGKK
ncbi:MAG: adenylyltransferase/cytidyltransferase family protein [Candidatus Paceibacterota bacterium]|jgi:D-beta-D-heptose 7-phosphate kinase/D-beta-D-heptose 1-phosphate adenosyltransferase